MWLTSEVPVRSAPMSPHPPLLAVWPSRPPLVGPYALPHDVRELGLRALQMVVDLAEHFARGIDDRVLADLTLRDLIHAPLELGGHLVRGYLRSEVGKGLGHAHALLRRDERVVVHVAAVVEVLDDVRAGRLGAEPEVLHHGNEAACAVAARGLGLLGEDLLAYDPHDVALREVRDLLVRAAAVRVHTEPTLLGNDGTARDERLTAGVEADRRTQRLRLGR